MVDIFDFLRNFVNQSIETMTASEKNTFGTRLKLARKMAGLSLQDLADALENKVTKQALSKYEQGLMNPSNEVLVAIAGVFKLKPDYFLKKKSTELGEILFRKKVRLAKKDEESIVERVRDYVERFLEIEDILGIESHFENPIQNIEIHKKEDVELAAEQLRKSWDLGSAPISNIVEMLELRGIKIYLSNEVDDFDGLAVFTTRGIPIVAVNTKDKPIERVRFTIIHELAHLLLDLDTAIKNNLKMMEEFCHYFASCFLIPTKKIIELIGSKRTYIKIEELISIKEYYGISIRATVHRLRELSVIIDSYYQRWMVYMSKTYGPKNEPGNYKGNESLKIFDQLINRALAEELISLSKAAALWNISINDLRKRPGGA